MASIQTKGSIQSHSKADERKGRAFWSLQILEFYHGDSTGASDVLGHMTQSLSNPGFDTQQSPGQRSGGPPEQGNHDSDSTDRDIFKVLAELAYVWRRARNFVSSCITDKSEEPWLANSAYTQILSDLTAAESRTPMSHRWQSVKFSDQDRDELRSNWYWKPWLGTQFTWHLVLTIMNHPFLYMAAAQHNKKLAVLNTFWTRSSQLALLHATWIVRLVDIVQDRQMSLNDPFFAQASAIAATVHLYYLSASNLSIKQKSTIDLLKSKSFLESFRNFSPLCAALVSST